MKCDDIRRLLSLHLYGELSFDEEESVDAHLDACAPCRLEMERERALHQAFDAQEMIVPGGLLRDARSRLSASLEQEHAGSPIVRWFRSLAHFSAFQRPVGAFALVAIGFFGAHVMPSGSLGGLQTAGLFDPNSARVRNVEPGSGGQIRIIVDETRQRTVSGQLDDAEIRGLLLAAVRDPSDPGIRGESVEILKANTGNSDVRSALLFALQHDTNPGVRLKALEGLKPFAQQAEVRQALSRALLMDDNPGIRTQAVDLLVNDMREPQIVGVLQELLQRENNGYIRLRCEKALHAVNASVESY